MNHISKILFLLFTYLFISQTVRSQGLDYKFAVGWRFGGAEGLTFKTGLGNSTAFEGILSIRPYGMGITGLFEKIQGTGVNSLNFYYGAGAHLGWNTGRNYYYRDNRKYFVYDREGFVGLDGILGIEFKFPEAPVAINFDLKPALNFYNNGGAAMYLDPGLGIKLAL